MLSTLLLIGAGCAPAATPVANTPAANAPAANTPAVDAPAAGGTLPAPEGSAPPAVVMTVGSESYPGVEGSYCWGGRCVDKIPPPQLVTEAGLSYKQATSSLRASFDVQGQVFEFYTAILDEAGTQLDYRIPTGFMGGKYVAAIPVVRGRHILMTQVRFGTSGSDDVTYYFPIDVE